MIGAGVSGSVNAERAAADRFRLSSDRVALNLRAEAFNVFNHLNFRRLRVDSFCACGSLGEMRDRQPVATEAATLKRYVFIAGADVQLYYGATVAIRRGC